METGDAGKAAPSTAMGILAFVNGEEYFVNDRCKKKKFQILYDGDGSTY